MSGLNSGGAKITLVVVPEPGLTISTDPETVCPPGLPLAPAAPELPAAPA
jgi:hypothetical protein